MSSGDYNTRVYVTPSSIATIVDAHERRGGEGDAVKKYVIGTCIGNIEGNNTYRTGRINCFFHVTELWTKLVRLTISYNVLKNIHL